MLGCLAWMNGQRRHLSRFALAGATLVLLAMVPAHTLEIEVKPATLATVAIPKPGDIANRLEFRGLSRGAPIYMRVFKEESILEVWMKAGDRFVLFETYPICKYDGVLGPKLVEGDRQSPEGFYTVAPGQLRFTGRWYRGFDLAYPNAYDADQGRTGSAILIHGGCGSIGCYAMTNAVIDELFELAAEAFDGGQQRFAVHVFPFRMTAANVARHNGEAWASFWKRLQPAYELFEKEHVPPSVSVCEAEYKIDGGVAGYDGSLPVARSCSDAAPIAGAVPASKPGNTAMGPLRSRLEEYRKLPPPIEYASVPKSGKRKGKAVIKAGLVVRCNMRLASCRKWVALRQSAKPKKRRTASAQP